MEPYLSILWQITKGSPVLASVSDGVLSICLAEISCHTLVTYAVLFVIHLFSCKLTKQ